MNHQRGTYNKCPYSLKLLTELEKVNEEHIFPDALGGGRDFSITVSEKLNSQLGTTLDSKLIDSPLIAGARLANGIKSRAGSPKWKMKGETVTTKRPIEITFDENGKMEIWFRKPVEMGDDGIGALIVKSEERDKFLKQFIKNNEKKGKTVRVSDEKKVLCEELKLDISFDILLIKRAMAKIAYGALYYYLGDAFLDDPLIPEWHNAIFKDNGEAEKSKIHGIAYNADSILKMMLPKLQPHEHAVCIGNFNQKGLVVAVTLFGINFHTFLAHGSETSNYGLQEAEGLVVVCDAKSKESRFLSLIDVICENADRLKAFVTDDQILKIKRINDKSQ